MTEEGDGDHGGPGVVDAAVPPGEHGDTSRILTIPNVISLVRLLCLPLFLFLLFGRDDRAAAAWLLAGLGTSDWVDGYIARHFDQVSEIGKILDPVADRLLFFVGIGGILASGAVPAPIAWIVLVREAAVGSATVVLGIMGARRIDVTWFGKAGTFANMMAFPSFLGSHSSLSYAPALGVLAWATVVPGIVLSYIAWVLYVPIARRALAEGRAGLATTPS